MKSILKGMYFGDVLPFGEIHPLHTECNQKAAKVLEAEKRILAAFPDSKELMEEYENAQVEHNDIYGYQQFLLGVRTGAQLVLELLAPVDSKTSYRS